MRLVVMTALAGVISGPFQPSLAASMWISPGRFVDCTMTRASPLKCERLGKVEIAGLGEVALIEAEVSDLIGFRTGVVEEVDGPRNHAALC